MYKVVVDRSHAMVNVVAEGFVTEAEIGEAAGALHGAIRSLGERAGSHVTLYDFARLDIASPKVLARFATYFTDPIYSAIWARRVALVTGSPLVHLQMARVRSDRVNLRVFDDRRAAIAWLLGRATVH
ncbi:hypothetical protein ASG29_11560 [Sphingomonas sp. Leaf412]|uniref:hypothetical protein n=1 Tax=Sphingomonas sp. Leaf412 TaxID=1736370 RepID=UPI000701F238|nr:hypothetical protein [Sphingomonas sp. Leaf412]KQT32417.1 hypothetical protein ASG29_11560 [Sphingomonas sp. Leaf412]